MNPDQDPETPLRPNSYPIESALHQAYSTQPDPRDHSIQSPSPAASADPATPSNKSASSSAVSDSNSDSSSGNSGQDSSSGNGALVCGLQPSSQAEAPARALSLPAAGDLVPESLHDSLRGLPHWQTRYVLALMTHGGVAALAASHCRVSRKSVEKAQREYPQFATACQEAIEHSTDLVEGSMMQSATVGDLEPVYRGAFLVGYQYKKSVKAAELMLKVRGRLAQGGGTTINLKTNAKVESVSDADLPAIVSGVVDRLFSGQRGRPTLDASTGEVL